MAQPPPQRSKADQIERLRRRTEAASTRSDPVVIAIIKGILDLLADEL